jgi:hypothetical protein
MKPNRWPLGLGICNSVLVFADQVLYSQVVSPPSESFAFEVIS